MGKTKKQIEETKIPIHNFEGDKETQLQKLYDQWFKCQRCHLGSCRMTEAGQPIDDIVFCSGNPNSGIMIIGEAPGEEEAKEMVPFVGRSGRLLNQILAAVSADDNIRDLYTKYSKSSHNKANVDKFHSEVFKWREKNFFLTNIVSCRPPDNRTPLPPEIKSCHERLLNMIYIVDPLIIIASGKTAAEALVGKKIEITMKRGELFEMNMAGKISNFNYPVILTLHPSFLLRKADWKDSGGDYTKTVSDFMKAMKIHDFLMEKNYGVPVPERGL
jgi:uracil-DNA glycosylase family 4